MKPSTLRTPLHCRPRSRSRRAATWRGCVALLGLGALTGCETERRPTGLVDSALPDVSLPDVPREDVPAPQDSGALDAKTPAPDAPLDGGAEVTGLDVPAPLDVHVDAAPNECCVDAAVEVARPLQPRSGGYVARRQPVFRWTPHGGAARYRVDLGASRAFTTATQTFMTAGAETTLAVTTDLPTARLWWRVVPLSAEGAELPATATWSVNVGRVANDLNADGFADIVVGAPEHDAPMLTDAGRVQVFFGGGGMDNTSDLTLDGAAAGEAFGRALSTAGDLNADGFADIAVGAPFAGPMQSGRVAVFLGGGNIPNTAALTLAGPQVNAQFGRNVAIAGDLNGDGFDDLVVSSPFFRGGTGTNAGHAWIFFGGSPMNAEVDVELDYTNSGDQLGFSVAGAGDVNGDGFADVLVGAPRNGVGGIDSGSAYVWWGGAPMDTGVDVIYLGLAPGSRSGDAVTALGDFNADGYADIALGAPGSAVGGPNAGAVLGFAGGTGVIPRPLFTLNGSSAERLGTAMAGGGDLDGDGYDDLLLGARDNSAGGALSGRAYVYRGGTGSAPVLGATYSVSMGMMGGGDEFGFTVALLGDANGDTYDDALVGAPNAPFMGTAGPGRVFWFGGGAALVTTPRQTFAPAAAGAFGYAIGRR